MTVIDFLMGNNVVNQNYIHLYNKAHANIENNLVQEIESSSRLLQFAHSTELQKQLVLNSSCSWVDEENRDTPCCWNTS